MSSYATILKLVWPLALGMANNSVMQFVDRAYLAQYSLVALEAVLPAGTLMFVFAGFFQSLVGYSNVLVGQYHGAGDDRRCHAAYHIATLVAVVCGVLSLPLTLVGNAILSMATTSGNLLADEQLYFTIVMLGSIAVYGQMAAAAYFTGRGQTRIVLLANFIGNILNIALDPMFIFGWCGLPRMGIAGAAIATTLSTFVQWIVLAMLMRRGHNRRAMPWAEQVDILRRLLRFGFPSALYEVLNMISFTAFVFVTGSVGELELAVSNACFSVNYLLFAPMMGFSLGAQTLVAQAVGRNDLVAAEGDARRTLLLGAALAIVTCLAVLAFSRPILGLFASCAGASTETFYTLGKTLLVLMSVWLVFDAIDIIIAGALKGAGDTRFVMMLSVVSSFFVWLPLVWAVRVFHNTMPVLWSTMIALVLFCFTVSVVRWRCGAWKRFRVTGI